MIYLAFICFLLFIAFVGIFLTADTEEMAKVSGILACVFLVGTILFACIADKKEVKTESNNYDITVISNSGNRVKFTDTETNKTYYIDIIKEIK